MITVRVVQVADDEPVLASDPHAEQVLVEHR